ncbi:Nephronectin [Exaiptasia diaphana]|nr:Nephronectin [Exaiptasia diaphana]
MRCRFPRRWSKQMWPCKDFRVKRNMQCIQVELDECLNPSSCNNNSRCFNTIGSYVCDCLPGYKKESGNCGRSSNMNVNWESKNVCELEDRENVCGLVDIDECATGSHSCHSSATCTNNHGSYSCACNDNFAGDGRKCTKTIIVSVTSGDPVEFKINEVKVSNEKAEHGINILVLNMNGTVHVPVKGFDTLHEKHGISAAQQTTLLYKLISSIPNNKIVLMGLFKSDHMPKQPTFDDLKTQFQAIGSNVKLHSEIVGKSGWSLIGYKGGQKPWMKESFDTNSLIATINPLE